MTTLVFWDWQILGQTQKIHETWAAKVAVDTKDKDVKQKVPQQKVFQLIVIGWFMSLQRMSHGGDM